MRRKFVVITGVAAAAVVLGGATVAGAANTLSGDDQPLSGTELQQAGDAALAHTGGGTVTEAEVENGPGSAYEVEVRRPDGSQVEVNLDSSYKVSGVEGPEHDDDSSGLALNAADRDKAASAALAKVGQGTVSEVEREGGAYEVEIRLDNGSEVEVQVGTDFQALNQSAPEFDDD
jgi:uncharacterized membrane protein YkoI